MIMSRQLPTLPRRRWKSEAALPVAPAIPTTRLPARFPATRLVARRRLLAGAALLLPVLLAACGSSAPPRTYQPLTYDYLLPLRLNVGSVDVQVNWRPQTGADVGSMAPTPPVQALARMGHDRLFPAGSTGQAVYVIDDASIIRNGNALYGTFSVHLDIVGADGRRTGYAEARVARTVSGPTVDDDVRSALYDLTSQMMTDMNVEFEYQVRRSLKDWLQNGNGSNAPAPVQAQPLTPPS